MCFDRARLSYFCSFDRVRLSYFCSFDRVRLSYFCSAKHSIEQTNIKPPQAERSKFMENMETEFLRNTEYKGIPCESACDFSLPDYKGEVKRVLYTKASVVPSSKFMDNSELTLSGIVVYNVVYLNSENGIDGIEFNSDYELSYKCPLDNAADFYADTRVANYNVRLTGPRKFSAKSSLLSDISVLESRSLESDYGDGAELKTKSLNMMHSRKFAPIEREYAEKLETLEGVIADDVRIISKEALISISSVARSGAEAVIKGEITVCAVIAYADVPPYSQCKRIPFEEYVPFENVSDSARLDASGLITSLSIGINPEEFVTDITADVIIELEVSAYDNSELTVATDGYYINCDAEASYEGISYTELVDFQKSEERVSLRIPFSELGIDAPREVVCVSAEVRVSDVSLDPKGAEVNAEIRVSGVVSETDSEGGVTYSGFKYSSPNTLNANISCQNCANPSTSASLDILAVDASVDRDFIDVECDIAVSLTVTQNGEMSRISAMSPLENTGVEKCASKICVYYPDSGEDLFAVAKRFHTTVKDIAVNNALTESVLNPVDGAHHPLGKLIIR